MLDKMKIQPGNTVPNFFADRRKLVFLLGIGVAVVVLLIISGVDGDAIGTFASIFFWAAIVIIGGKAKKKGKAGNFFGEVFSKNKTEQKSNRIGSKAEPSAFSDEDKVRGVLAAVGVVVILLTGLIFFLTR